MEGEEQKRRKLMMGEGEEEETGGREKQYKEYRQVGQEEGEELPVEGKLKMGRERKSRFRWGEIVGSFGGGKEEKSE